MVSVEARMAALETALTTMNGDLQTARADAAAAHAQAQTAEQRAVAAETAAAAATAAGLGVGGTTAPTTTRPRVGIDTRNIGKPESFSGEDSRWRDWAVVFRSYSCLVNPRLEPLMKDAERRLDPALKSLLATDEDKGACQDLYHLLLHLTRSQALDRVVNASPGEGLEAWRSLVQRYDPRLRSRAAGQLLELLKWDFTGDVLVKLEAFERGVTEYQIASGEVLSDGLRIGIVLNLVKDVELAAHLLFNSERLATWHAFRSEIVNISKARAAAAGVFSFANAGGLAPMDVGALNTKGPKGGGRGGKGSETRTCHNCGKPGHLAKYCRKPVKGGPKGGDSHRGGKAASSSGGHNTQTSPQRETRKCHKCGKPGHLAKDCRSKGVHGLEDDNEEQREYEPEQEVPGATGQGAQGNATTLDGLWLTGVEMVRDDDTICQICSVDEYGRQKIRFGVDSGAGVTVIKESEAMDYPKQRCGGTKKMKNCSGVIVPDLGDKVLGLRYGKGNLRFAKVTCAPVAKNLMAVSSLVDTDHEVVFRHESRGGSFVKHFGTGETMKMERKDGVFDLQFALEAFRSLPKAPSRG